MSMNLVQYVKNARNGLIHIKVLNACKSLYVKNVLIHQLINYEIVSENLWRLNMNDSYLAALLTTLKSEQKSDYYCLSDEYLSKLKIRIEERESVIKELEGRVKSDS